MKHPRHHDWQLPFIDMLLLMVALFASLYIITLLQVNPPAKKADIDLKAEYIITLTWPDSSFDDIDLHVMLPSKEMVNFSKKENTYVTLDRDDLGVMNDRFMDQTGEKFIYKNKEIITIRAIVPGTYVVNVHAYRQYKKWTLNDQIVESTPPLPYNVHVTLQRLNPMVADVASVDVPLLEIGDQKTAFSFEVIADGSIKNVNTTEDILFIPRKPDFPPPTTFGTER